MRCNKGLDLEILRINRQIYSEARALLYSQVPLAMELANIPGAEEKYGRDLVLKDKTIWRHGSPGGVSLREDDGSYVYSRPHLNGLMDPHVFANFQRFFINANFNFQDRKRLPMLLFDNTLHIDPRDRSDFAERLRNMTILEPLVQLLSNLPILRELSITFAVGASYTLRRGITVVAGEMQLVHLARDQIVELFLDCGVLQPLAKLSNVQSFNFEFEGRSNNYYLQLRQRERLEELKATIKSNWKEKSKSPAT